MYECLRIHKEVATIWLESMANGSNIELILEKKKQNIYLCRSFHSRTCNACNIHETTKSQNFNDHHKY